MKAKLLDHLECPSCASDLTLNVSDVDAQEILNGQLACQGCDAAYPIVRGVPRFVDVAKIEEDKAATAEAFGFEWQHFTQKDERYREQFLGWIAPVTPEFFRGKIILDGGCGKGRHMKLAREWGASEVIAVDISDAVETAFEEARNVENLHVVQADLCR